MAPLNFLQSASGSNGEAGVMVPWVAYSHGRIKFTKFNDSANTPCEGQITFATGCQILWHLVKCINLYITCCSDGLCSTVCPCPLCRKRWNYHDHDDSLCAYATCMGTFVKDQIIANALILAKQTSSHNIISTSQ